MSKKRSFAYLDDWMRIDACVNWQHGEENLSNFTCIDRRIMKELQHLQTSKPHGITVSVPSDNVYIWEAEFAAPEQSLYKGAHLKIQIVFSENYPLAPPSVRFLTRVYHVNIDQQTGHVCLGFVSDDQWNPTNGIEDVLRAIFSLLITPQQEIAADQGILAEFRESLRIYERKARTSAKKLS